MNEQTVHGITEADYQSWRHHPVSKVVLGFLRDKRSYLERTALDQWLDGQLSLQADQTLRGQIIEVVELERMPFAAMAEFYAIENERELDAAEVSENDNR